MNIVKYNSLEILENHIKEQRIIQSLLVICAPEKKNQVANLCKIKIIVCYPSETYRYF